MLRVRIKDFQSIQDGSFTIEGFTVVTGTNNLGKSALFRAIKGIFTNPAATFVRHGQKFATVEISDEHRSVEWKKGPKVSAVYKLRVGDKSQTFENVGHACPPEVLEAFGIGTLQAGTTTLWPQFADQFTGPLFLLDKPGSAIADAVANVERIQKLNKALKACEKDKRATAASLKVRKKDQDAIDLRLVRFDGLDEVAAKVDALEGKRKQAERIASGYRKIERLRRQYDRAKAQVALLAKAGELALPEDDAKAVGEELREVRLLRERLVGYRSHLERLEGYEGLVTRLPAQGRLDSIRRLQEGLQKLRRLGKQIGPRRAAVERWTKAAETAREPDRSVDAKVEQIQQVLSLLRGLRREMRSSKEQVETCDRELKTALAGLEALNDEIAEALGHYDECPLCGVSFEHVCEEEDLA